MVSIRRRAFGTNYTWMDCCLSLRAQIHQKPWSSGKIRRQRDCSECGKGLSYRNGLLKCRN